MSNITPITSPVLYYLPYFYPVELELCLNSPLYIAHPYSLSLKAYYIKFMFTSWYRPSIVHTPIFISDPFTIRNS